MSIKKIALWFAVFFAITPLAGANPSIYGATGMIHTPTADTLRTGQFSLGYYHLNDGWAGVVNFNLMKRLEVGASLLRYDKRDNQTLLNAKYAIIEEKVLVPGIAVGIEDIKGDRERAGYAVVSKSLPLGFRIHAGIGGGRMKDGFGGLEVTIKPLAGIGSANMFPTTTLMVEYDGREMNYGLRLALVPGLKAHAGWRDKDFFMGLTYLY